MLFLLHRSISESLCRNCVSFICWYIKMDFFFFAWGGNVPAPPTTPPPPTLLLKKSFLRSFEIDKRLFFSIRFVPLVIFLSINVLYRVADNFISRRQLKMSVTVE